MYQLWESLSADEHYRLDRWVDCTVVWLFGLLALGLLSLGQAIIMVGSATGIIMTALGGGVLLLIPSIRLAIHLNDVLPDRDEPEFDD
ncbi:MAG: hypothetical protein WC802_03520 [Patescibacteria group bacterium]|jgi:hypothetical protein